MTVMSRLFLLILTVAIPLGLLQGFSVHKEQKERRDDVTQVALRTAKRAAAEQRRVVDGARQMLTALAQIPIIRGNDPTRCSAFLHRLRDQFPIYIAIGVSSPKGQVWCSSTVPGTDVSDRPYFRRAIADRRFTTGGYVVGRVVGRSSLNFSYPFYDDEGHLLGVLIAGLDLDRLAADISRAELPRASQLAIAGPDRRVLVDLPTGASLGRQLPPAWNRIFESRTSGNTEAEWMDGGRRLIGFVPPSGSGDFPFLVAVGIDHASAMAPVIERGREDLALLFVTVALALLLAWWFATRFVRSPLRRLTGTVRKWREGDSTARVHLLDSSAEFEDLARTFNAMAEAVEERQQRLRDTLESTTDSVVMVEPDWAISFLNDRARLRLQGIEALGRNLWEVFPDVRDGSVKAELVAAMCERRPVTVDFESQALVGRFEVNAFPAPEGGLTLFVRDVTEEYRAQEKLRELALGDPLTGLFNRFHALDVTESAVAAGRLTAAVLIDIDGLKHVNDSLGHAAGDEVLRQAAKRLSLGLQPHGLAARVGGDEFIALIFEMERAKALDLAETLLDYIQQEPFAVRGRILEISVSAGVVFLEDARTTNVEELMADSDLALHRAKAASGGTCHVYSPEDRKAYEARRLLEEELAQAASIGEFEVYYQPQVRLSDGALVGAEALIRWRHPRHGLLGPDAFIALLATTRHARMIGEWVLRQACKEAAAWRRAGHDLRIGVNLFADQIRSGELVALVERTLAEHGLPPQALELELTENIALGAEDGARATLLALRSLGVHLAFDDFGTGFASLTTLKDIPVNRLKIDRGFVTDLPHDENDKAIVEAVLALARTLGLEVIAEGVETAEQERYLRSRGCQEAQGYRYAVPMPARDFRDYILSYDVLA